MTDWGPGRWLSNQIWGSNAQVNKQSFSRNMVHGVWHTGAYVVTRNQEDKYRSKRHFKFANTLRKGQSVAFIGNKSAKSKGR